MKGLGTVAAEWDFSGSPDRDARYLRRSFSLLCTCRYGRGDSALMFA